MITEEKVKNLGEIQKEVGIGFWVWEFQNDKLYWDSGMHSIFGTNEKEFKGNYEEFSKKVKREDLDRIEKSLSSVIKSTDKDFVNVLAITVKGETRYLKAYGFLMKNKASLAGVNILITKEEYEKGLFVDSENIEVIRNYAARKTLFNLKRQFVKPYKFYPKEENGEWVEMDQEVIKNTKYRVLSFDKTSHLITEWLCMNASMDSHYHEEDELISNLGENSIDVWIDGEHFSLKKKNSILIPAGCFHKIKFDGVCHFMVTWFDYYVDDQIAFKVIG